MAKAIQKLGSSKVQKLGSPKVKKMKLPAIKNFSAVSMHPKGMLSVSHKAGRGK